MFIDCFGHVCGNCWCYEMFPVETYGQWVNVETSETVPARPVEIY